MSETGFTLKNLSSQEGWNYRKNTVPKGKYFVMGDNRYISNDSRYWGFVPKNKVEGTVKVPFWNK